jgi:CP family cyanate transporter-like MFS transporter
MAMGPAALGLLGALPLIGFALVSPVVSHPARRWGMDRTVLVALVVLVIGCLVRPAGGAGPLWFGTALIGVAAAVGNVLVPAIVKRDFAGRVALATGVYTAVISGSAALASGVAVPLTSITGEWRSTFAAWALLPALAGVLWWVRIRLLPGQEVEMAGPTAPRVGLLRSPAAWQLTAFMGLQSFTFYLTITWLPTIEGSFGIPPEVAGLHLLLFQAVGIPVGLLISMGLHRWGNYRAAAMLVSVPMVVAAPGLIIAPELALLWAVLAGMGGGSSLTVAFALIAVRAGSTDDAARLSGMTQSLGYLLAAAGPVVAGVLAARMGTWQPVLVLLGGAGLAQLVVSWWAGSTTRVGSTPRPVASGVS